MDATTRWETEAIRNGPTERQSPPKPTRKKISRTRSWVTLKEAEAATGIPSNTLRKWVRKDALDSYLESDGDLALRMVDLDDVKRRAKELGREVHEQPLRAGEPPVDGRRSTADANGSAEDDADAVDRRPLTVDRQSGGRPSTVDRESDAAWPVEGEVAQGVPEGTMLVPVDAWNKMLAQLGNLHEAGQQLADARERAAKAETEATFLRERLAEERAEASESSADRRPAPAQEPDDVASEPSTVDGRPSTEAPQAQRPTTTYWRYVTTGWRARRRP